MQSFLENAFSCLFLSEEVDRHLPWKKIGLIIFLVSFYLLPWNKNNLYIKTHNYALNDFYIARKQNLEIVFEVKYLDDNNYFWPLFGTIGKPKQCTFRISSSFLSDINIRFTAVARKQPKSKRWQVCLPPA